MNIFKSNFLNGQSRTITSAAIILAITSLASRFLGLLRDRLLAGQFGAGDTLDVYYAAFRIPDLVFNLLVFGALVAGFIPTFLSYWRADAGDNQKVSAEGWRFVNVILNLFFIVLLVIGGLFFIFTPYLMKLITPGFNPEKLALTVQLTRMMFLSPLLLGLSSVFGGVLESLKRFLIFSLTPIVYNFGIIFGVLFLVPRFGIYGLAGGVILGAFFHLVIQIPAVWSLGWRYKFILDFKDKGMRRVLGLMGPRVLTLAVGQLNFIAITIIASALAAGSLAIFNLSFNIWSFPLGIIAASLAIAAFPTLTANAQMKNWSAFVGNFSTTFRQIFFLIIPSSALFIILRAQIVRVALGSGKFNWENTILTAQSLMFLTFGLFAEALIMLLVRGFFAVEDTKTPFWLGLVSSIFRIGCAWVFSLVWGVAGLALGYSFGAIIYFLLLWVCLRRKIARLSGSAQRHLNEKEIIISVLKIVAASLLAGAAAWGMLRLIDNFVDMQTLLGVFAQGFIAGLAGLAVYFLAGLLFRSQEMGTFWKAIKNRLPFKAVAPDKELIEP